MKSSVMLCLLFLMTGIGTAQERVQFFAHEEHVKPSMNGEYVAWLKKVRSEYERTQVDMRYSVFFVEDNSYIFFSPMETFNVNSIFKTFTDAEAKIGRENIQRLYQEKGAYINSYRDFITELLPQYTYLSPAQDENFRQMMFWVPIPGNEDKAHAIAKEWVDLHKSRNAPAGYQTFMTVFGGEPAWVIVTWGKDQIDQITKSVNTNKLLGEDAAKLWARTMKITQKIHHQNGWFRPDLSYTSPQVVPK